MTEHMDRDALTEELGRLPTEIQPEHDLWPGIEARLESRQSADLDHGQSTSRARNRSETRQWGGRQWGAREWGLQSLAALLFMALGSLFTWLAVGTLSNAPLSPEAGGNASAGGGAVAKYTPQTAGSIETVSFGAPAGHPLDVVEANYLRARDALWLQAVENRDALPPGTLKVVERNLEILERAISDLRKALALDPGNPNLERRLLDNHQRSIDMLRRVVREV